mmetsp:Transcript_26155/g.71732  ORF Transcript_26155/g.71732 Transcript_26155/m.71732 type:complete len:90 (+) Transcript_26155:1363-1632(+)
MEEGCVHRSCYRRRGLLSFPPGTGPGPLTSPASSLRIDAASPPDFTAEVTIRANAHTEHNATQRVERGAKDDEVLPSKANVKLWQCANK